MAERGAPLKAQFPSSAPNKNKMNLSQLGLVLFFTRDYFGLIVKLNKQKNDKRHNH